MANNKNIYDSHQALLIIDYTNGFVDDKGALTAGKPGQRLDNHIIKLADKFIDNHDWVIIPTDIRSISSRKSFISTS